MTDITPPPPSLPSGVVRCHDLRSNRPGGSGTEPISSSRRSKPAHSTSLSSSNHRRAASFCASSNPISHLHLAGLAQSLSQNYCAGNRHIQRAHAVSHWDSDLCTGTPPHLLAHAARFTAEHQDVIAAKCKGRIGHFAPRSEQHLPLPGSCRAECLIRGLPNDLRMIEIIEARPAQRSVVPGEACRLDDVNGHVEAGSEPQDRSYIGWNVGLIKGDLGHR